jgi:hypothetical protein
MNKPAKKRATKSAEDCSELDARFLGRLDSIVGQCLPTEGIFVVDELPDGGMIITLNNNTTWEKFYYERELLLQSGKLDHLIESFFECIEDRIGNERIHE